ncbi:DIAP2-like protein [Mya arenaria]|uniref:DIAP2-like protein n=1 Tax=Mya arenaria TaxID=6604 RepID=A0ABY7EHI3_MYAAR|nr:DIAP2-like protein [Mya arenaria]
MMSESHGVVAQASEDVEMGEIEENPPSSDNRMLHNRSLNSIVCITFLPCGHLATCLDCSTSLHECPMCRRKIEDKVRTYWS